MSVDPELDAPPLTTLMEESVYSGWNAFDLHSADTVLRDMLKLVLISCTDPKTGEVTLSETDYAAILEYCSRFTYKAEEMLSYEAIYQYTLRLPVVPGYMSPVHNYGDMLYLMTTPYTRRLPPAADRAEAQRLRCRPAKLPRHRCKHEIFRAGGCAAGSRRLCTSDCL